MPGKVTEFSEFKREWVNNRYIPGFICSGSPARGDSLHHILPDLRSREGGIWYKTRPKGGVYTFYKQGFIDYKF